MIAYGSWCVMNVIKFKAWDKINKKFVTNYKHVLPAHYEGMKYPVHPGGGVNYNCVYVPIFDGDDINNLDNYQSDCRLLLFTGFKDIDGKYIFDEDIIQDQDKLIYRVMWDEDHGCWMMVQQHTMYKFSVGIFITFQPNKIKVIGNMYENSEVFEPCK